MENNQTDFMKNRPVASYPNQIKDVYGSQKRSTRVTVSFIMSIVVFILMMIGIFTGNNFMMVIFIPLFVLLMISFILGRRADRQNSPVEPQESKEALFKDHDV